jgi:hypothetical protein
MSAIEAPTWRAQLADPKPPFCAGCLRGADAETKFVDLGMPSDRGYVRDLGTMSVVAELNRLCLCESCVREMAECLAFDPRLHRNHLARLRQEIEESRRKDMVIDAQDRANSELRALLHGKTELLYEELQRLRAERKDEDGAGGE